MFFSKLVWSYIGILLSFSSLTAETLTHEKLLELQKQSAARQVPRTTKPAKYQRAATSSLLESSDILCSGGIWTLVPKNSILTKPDRLSSKVTSSPRGKFVNWQEFLSKNRAWLSTEVVNIATSSGSTKIDYERYHRLRSKGQIVVAVLNQGPISVTPDAIIKEQ